MTLVAAPALPLHSAGKYVAGAYIVLVIMLVVYLGIMTVRARRTRRELSELRNEVAERRAREELDGPHGDGPTTNPGRRTERDREVAR
jgi:flagellar biosynthesis/type III secretory pathway M-ring protein FliF/YscJ